MEQVTKIKLCGLRSKEDIEAVKCLRPDYAGFILTKRFWRYADIEMVKYATNYLDSGIKTVGVVVDEPIEYVASLLTEGIVNIIQLHGVEDDSYIKKLRNMVSGCVIHKAYKITSKEDILRAEQSLADEILLDSGEGCGKSFDWSLVDGVNRRFFLAGGLTPANVGRAIEQIHPWAVDVSSGIETEKIKDVRKMQAFVEAVRLAEPLRIE